MLGKDVLGCKREALLNSALRIKSNNPDGEFRDQQLLFAIDFKVMSFGV